MKLEVKDKNYCASVVILNRFIELPGCDNIKHTIIFGNSVVVGKDAKEGDIGLFFPVETKLSPRFLQQNNLYRDNTLNTDTTKKGFFESKGRVKCCKMRGYKSSGFFIPLTSLDYLGECILSVGQEFNSIDEIIICEKYIVEQKVFQTPGSKKQKQAVKISRLVDGQFRFHGETLQLRKNIEKINPDDIISLTSKLHGSSVVLSNILINVPFPKWKKLVSKVFKLSLNTTEYSLIFSSRKVIKNGFINAQPVHFYDCDIWGLAAKKYKDCVLEGISLYSELVGYTPSGAMIQPGYHYGCKEKQFEMYVYRITYTNISGHVFEFTLPQIKEYCIKFGLKHVPELYYGKAKDYAPELNTSHHWNNNLLERLEKDFMLDKKCAMNNYEVPEEGIVLRIESLNELNSFKLKNWAFLAKETEDLDKDILDIETSQSIEEETT